MSEARKFNAADVYEPLVSGRATDEQLLSLLIGQASPLLPTHVLRPDQKQPRIHEILSILTFLRSRYAAILEQNGLSALAAKVKDRRRIRTMDPASICREIEDRQVRDKIRTLLAQERNLLSAELLERLGFLPPHIFERDNEGEPQANLFEDGRSDIDRRRAESRFMLLREMLEHEGFKPDVLSEPERVHASLTPLQMTRYPQNARLARWVADANKDFDQAIHDAFNYLGKLFKDAAPPGIQGQPFEQISDIGSKSFVELIEVILDKKLPIRTRFESMRLLEWSIAFFSLKRNPIFQAQRAVRARINQILEEEFWHSSAEKLPVEVAPELLEVTKVTRVTLSKEENVKHDREDRQETPVILRARKVCAEVETILKKSHHIDEKSDDRIIFGGREKSEYSIARKIFLLQLLVQKCLATLEDHETDMTKYKAREELKRLQERLLKRGKKPKDIRLKRVGFDCLNDDVGYSLSINLKKPLSQYHGDERKEVTALFDAVGMNAAQVLGLQNIKPDNFLWKKNHANRKSVEGFRLYKVHGEYPIETEVFVEGRLETKTIMVPVEIQILPVETLLRSRLPGDVSTDEYERRKARELAQRTHPTHIADKEVYTEAFDVGRFANVLNRTAVDGEVFSAAEM